MPAPTETELPSHVLLFMAAASLGTERPTPLTALNTLLKSTPPSPQGREAAAKRADSPMSATVLLAATGPFTSTSSPITAACATLGDEQLVSHDLLDRLVKRLLPVLAREAPGADVASTIHATPSTLSAQSPMHADLQDRVKRQREVNRRLQRLLERVVV